MSNRLRYKGQYVKKKQLAQKLKFVSAMQEAQKKKAELTENEESVSNLGEGRRIVELKELGKNLKCFKCKRVLSLENLEKESHLGLNSILWVRCSDCSCVSQVKTGKAHIGKKKYKISDVNSKAVLAALHAGVGHTALSKIFACLNIPQLPHSLFKRYEREVGPALEEAAKESCKRAAKEEKELIIQNIEELCAEL